MDFSFFINNIEFFVFVLIMILFLYIKRKKVEINGSYPMLYMVMYKTRLGLDRMKKWSSKYPNFYKYLSYLSIFIGIAGIFLSTIFMFWQLNFIVQKGLVAGGGLVLPIQTEGGLNSAVPVFYVPFWYWILALSILIVVHEFAHGVIAEKWKIKVKSSGFAFLGVGVVGIIMILYQVYNLIIGQVFNWGLTIFGAVLIFFPIMPAAFVEPDEKELKKAKWWKQIAVFGAGSMSNFIFGFLFLLMAIFIANPILNSTTQVDDITFNGVTNMSSLHKYNVTSGKIIEFNGITDKEEIYKFLTEKKSKIGESYDATIENQDGLIGTYNIKPYVENNQTFIGISNVKPTIEPKENFRWLGNIPKYFAELLNWLFILNIGIGIMNLLPIWITDGGQITLLLLNRKFKKKTSALLFNLISIMILVLLFFTLKPSLLFTMLGM